MKLLRAIEKAKALLKEQGLEDWSVFTNDSCSVVAKVQFDRKRLIYSKRYIMIATEQEFHDTTMHEIAHILVPHDENHGSDFIDKCRELCTPYSEYCIESPIHKYNMTCPKCERGCGTNSNLPMACPYCMCELVRTPNVLLETVWASTP